MKSRFTLLMKSLSLGMVLLFGVLTVSAQDTTKGEIKKSGGEAKEAGVSLGQHMKHGRVVRGGKSFGKHVGKAGKHFGRSTKKAFKKVFS